jgi:hypothetical protein
MVGDYLTGRGVDCRGLPGREAEGWRVGGNLTKLGNEMNGEFIFTRGTG